MVSKTVREQATRRQREYKARLRKEGGASIHVVLQRGIPAKLDALAQRHDVSRQGMINALIHSPPDDDRITRGIIATTDGEDS